jgi:hypothetical protein
LLIGFLGAPCSGKTTTAARLFSDLKNLATPSEFICEQARTFIAVKRNDCQDKGVAFTLDDQDQLTIARRQFFLEQTMVRACGVDVEVISDTSTLNSALYMSDPFRMSAEVDGFIRDSVTKYDLLFYCHLVPRFSCYDPNRVHTEAQSIALDEKLQKFIQEYCTGKEVIPLAGPTTTRVYTAFEATLRHRAA